MRNLGLFFPAKLDVGALTNLGVELGGQWIDDATLRFGENPCAAYLDLDTNLSNGCFDNEEFQLLRNQLGFDPEAYVSIHMDNTRAAFDRALSIAESLQARWSGKIDYSGAGGTLQRPFEPPVHRGD